MVTGSPPCKNRFGLLVFEALRVMLFEGHEIFLVQGFVKLDHFGLRINYMPFVAGEALDEFRQCARIY